LIFTEQRNALVSHQRPLNTTNRQSKLLMSMWRALPSYINDIAHKRSLNKVRIFSDIIS